MAAGFVIRTLVPESSIFDLAYPSTTNLSGKSYLFAVDNGTEIAVAGAGDATLGVLQDGFDGSVRTNVATVRTCGLTKILLGDDVSAMTFVKSDTNGAAVAAGNKDSSEGYVLDGGLSGEIVVMVIQHSPTIA